MHGSGVSESVQIHLYVLRDRLGALSTRLTLHGLRGHNLPQQPRCVYSHPVASVHIISTAGSLYRAFSDGIDESLIEIKLKTQDDHMRTCVSELEGAGDASALKSTIIGHVCGQLSAPSHQYFIVTSR